MSNVFFKELRAFLDSFIAYVVVTVFLTGVGMLMWVFPDTSVLYYGYADMSTLFSLAPYAFVFLVPAITMRSFSEEKKMGTLELLVTKPMTEWSIILGKFLAVYSLVFMAVLPTLVYYFSVVQLGDPVGNIDSATVFSSYMALLLLGGAFCSIGIVASLLTSSQILAFIMGSFMSLVLYSGFDSFSSLITQGNGALQIKQLGMLYHYDAMSRGVIDSRHVLYFISFIGIMIVLARTVMTSRKW